MACGIIPTSAVAIMNPAPKAISIRCVARPVGEAAVMTNPPIRLAAAAARAYHRAVLNDNPRASGVDRMKRGKVAQEYESTKVRKYESTGVILRTFVLSYRPTPPAPRT